MRYTTHAAASWLSLGVLCLACDQSASVGNMCAAPRTRCDEVETDDKYLDALDQRTGAFAAYAQLAPTWTREKSSSSEEFLERTRLSAAEAGTVWMLEPQASSVRVLTLGDGGELIEQAQLEAPRMAETISSDAPSPPQLLWEHPDARGPVLRLRWWYALACDERSRGLADHCTTSLDEVLVFSTDPSAAPRRLRPELPEPLAFAHEGVVRAASGDDLLLPNSHMLTRVDGAGKELWTQASAGAQFVSSGLMFSVHAGSPAASIAALDDGQIAFLPFAGYVMPSQEPQYWVVDADGAVLDAQRVPARDLQRSALFRAPNGDKLIAGDTHDGDLVLLAIHADDSAFSFDVPREHFTFQELLGASMDSAGTLYAATYAGGRDTPDQFSLLCRLVDGREGDCFVASDVAEIVDIQAAGPDVLYTLSRDGSLRRFDFPR